MLINKILHNTEINAKKKFENYSYILFTFILTLFSAWSWQLLPYNIIKIFDSNRKAQLIVLFLLILFTLDFLNPETSFAEVIFKTFFMFFTYLLITKQSATFFILTISMLILLAFLKNGSERINILIKSEKNKENKYFYNQLSNYIEISESIIIILTIIISFLGISKYLIKNYKDHIKKSKGNVLLWFLKYLFEGSRSQQKKSGKVITF